jgi:hypothetical protein
LNIWMLISDAETLFYTLSIISQVRVDVDPQAILDELIKRKFVKVLKVTFSFSFLFWNVFTKNLIPVSVLFFLLNSSLFSMSRSNQMVKWNITLNLRNSIWNKKQNVPLGIKQFTLSFFWWCFSASC